MNKRISKAPEQLRIWQQNTHKSQTAQDYVINTARPEDWDIIAIQEPWIDSLGKSRASQYWRVVYPANYYEEEKTRVRSVLLINTNISTDCYCTLPILHSDITGVRFKGPNGNFSVINVYNEITNNDTIDFLDLFLTANPLLVRPMASDHMIWLGDFNRHHPMWEDDANSHLFEAENFISPLLNLLYSHDMIMALPKGLPTFQTCAGRWTRPDNVWHTNAQADPIQCCEVLPNIRPPLADHMPIITVVYLPLPRVAAPPILDFRLADWPSVNTALDARLSVESPAVRIQTKEEFIAKVDTVVKIIKEVLEANLEPKRPSPYARRWWTKDLSKLRTKQNKLSNQSYKFRLIPNHPSHAEHKTAVKEFKALLNDTKKQNWIDWLENVEQKDVYLANKYIASEPTDYSCTRVPPLRVKINGVDGVAEDNISKVNALSQSFFPPPPVSSSVPPGAIYPKPLKGIRFFSRARIRQVFKTLSPYKAPGQDGIPNVVLIKCIDALVDHIFFIYRAVFELKVYHPAWLESLTLVLRKIGKSSYDVAKAYRPIGLIDTIPKGLSTLGYKHVSYLMEKHNLLPAAQFGGRPGRNTTDAMLLIVDRIKSAWRAGKVAAALFLDVQGAFPNTVKDQLLHNMKMRRVPTCFVDLTAHKLTGRSTRLKFDDFTSDPIPLDNGTTQGDPDSMLLYGFYNAPLIETASSPDELSPGFVDDSMMLAIGDSLAECHLKLKDMMERPNGGLEWSTTHNSPFELSKTALMNFPRSHRDTLPGNLVLNKTNPDGSISAHSISAVLSYKYLGVIFDPSLRWKFQHAKAHASATFWTSRIWRLSKPSNGLKPGDARQLYTTVSVPGFTYGAEVWYTPATKLEGGKKMKGSVAVTNKLRSTQRKAAKTITGALSTTAGDVLDIHTDLLPVDLLLSKILFRAAVRICSLPPAHPLHNAIRRAARRSIKRHRSPLHNLLHLSKLSPNAVETISTVRRSPGYVEAFDSFICDSKDQALEVARALERHYPVQVFCDGSGFEGGVGASAVLYENNRITKTLHYHLGSELEHTVYEAEGIGIVMALHLLKTRNKRIVKPLSISSDSQALIKALGNQRPHAGHYILDKVHDLAEDLHAKQDGLLNRVERLEALAEGYSWKGRTKGVIDLHIHWVPGHCDYDRNEKADEEAKKAAQGLSSDAKSLPPFLRKSLPASVSALQQNFRSSLYKTWKQHWKTSPRHDLHRPIDKSAPSRKYLKLVKGLDRRQASLLTQLRTGHIGLNKHLFRIRKVESPVCPHCQGLNVESVKHILLDCPFYRRERHALQLKLRRNASSIPFLLGNPAAVKHTLTFARSTGRFKEFEEPVDKPETNARRTAELIAGARTLGLL